MDGIKWPQVFAALFPAIAAVLGAWQAVQSGLNEMRTTQQLLEVKMAADRERYEQIAKKVAEHDQRLHDYEYWLRQPGDKMSLIARQNRDGY